MFLNETLIPLITTTIDPSKGHVYWYEIMDCDINDKSCENQWEWIHIAALIPSTLSIIASVFIIVSGIIYHRQLSNLTFGAKLPIFISISDLLFELNHGGDHVHNLIQGYVSEGWLCQLFGCMKPFSINCQTTWALGTAVYLNRFIRNTSKKEPNFGKYNIYLHLLCWGIPSIILVVGFIFDVYGVEGPWCGIPNPLIDLLMVDLWILVTLFILIINYSYVGYYLRNIVKNMNNTKHIIASNSNSNRTSYSPRQSKLVKSKSQLSTEIVVKKAIKTIGLYPVAYFIQWLFFALFKTKVIAPTFENIILVVTTANCGGMFNLILYYPLLFNQVKREKKKIQQKKRRNTNTNTNSNRNLTQLTSVVSKS